MFDNLRYEVFVNGKLIAAFAKDYLATDYVADCKERDIHLSHRRDIEKRVYLIKDKEA